MDARIRRPGMGMAAFCATLIVVLNSVATAQYGRPVGRGPQPGMHQPFVQGMPGGGAAPMRAPGGGAHQSGAGQSANFIVLCNDPNLTHTVSKAAEQLRRDLAIHWLGEELPNWSRRCPIHVTSGPTLGAGGETRFALYNGNVGDWNMSVQGTPERILDSVLPHEITHTILASHFAPLNVHVPRWADEGACTTVEHSSEQDKHKSHLVQYLSTGRGLSFNRMFSLKDYPHDILPLYAQGHSVVEFLIAQGGPRKFVQFLEDGMQSQRWEAAIKRAYQYETLGQLQTKWNLWIADGRGPVERYAANPDAASAIAAAATLASNSRPAAVPSLDAAPASSSSPDAVTAVGAAEDEASVEELLEGASVALAAHTPSINDHAVTPISANTTQSLAVANRATDANVADVASPADMARAALMDDVNNLARAANTDEGAAAGSVGEGFFRQRLESQLRDIVRVAPNQAASAPQPASRTASLGRSVGGPLLSGTASARATSRPQPAQGTPMRVLDAGNQLPSAGQPIYR